MQLKKKSNTATLGDRIQASVAQMSTWPNDITLGHAACIHGNAQLRSDS